MPWTGASFRKHNKGLGPQQSAHAARIANAVLKRSGDDGMSIAVANKFFQHRADGGDVEPPDMTGQYNTQLTPDEEARYQAWVGTHGSDNYDYDQRGFWKDGAAYAPNGHGGDLYKKPNHPTFSTQSRYNGVDGFAGGAWGGGQDGKPWTFTPSDTNLKMHSAGDLQHYFKDPRNGETENQLILPQRAAGGYTPDQPQISREDDAEVLSHGRPQGRDVDINLTPPPPIHSPYGAIGSRPSPSWLPGPIPVEDTPVRKHLDMGGDVGFGGATPSLATMNPIAQQQTGSFSQMSPEQLQETALRLKGSSAGQLAQRVLQQKRIMSAQQPQPGQQQAQPGPGQQPLPGPATTSYAQGGATDPAAGPPRDYALGGSLEQKGGVHMVERGIPTGGFLNTAGPGRTDNLNIRPHADSYVLPADVVSGLGEGNSLAGAKALDLALHTGPHGIPMPTASHVGHRMGPPRPPAVGGGGGGGGFSGFGGFGGLGHAGGGHVDRVPIVAAGGEYIISPEQCRAIGHGDISRGHNVLDKFVLHIRSRTVKDMSKLKGPVKS